MDDRELKRLLSEADRGAEPALPPDGRLGCRIRQLDRRRRQRQKTTLAALGLIAAGGLALGSLWRPSLPEAPVHNEVAQDAPTEVDIAQARAELAELQAEIERQEAKLAALLDAELRAKLNRRMAAVGRDFQSDFQREIDRAALTMLIAADWKIERHGMIESARSDYEHVVKSFSQTQWADAARQRLAALQN